MSKKVRFNEEEGSYVEIFAKKLGLETNDFIVNTVMNKIDDLQDEFEKEEINEIIREIKSGERLTISWEECCRNLDQ